MMSGDTPHATDQIKPFGRFMLARAGWILALFTVLLWVTFPPIYDEGPYREPNLIPVLVVLVLGAVTWIAMFVTCMRAFRTASERPSIISSVMFFLFFGCELLFAAFAVRHL
jgi:hypothetical protein